MEDGWFVSNLFVVNGLRLAISFPRSAWECRPRRSASVILDRRREAAERPRRHSHAERGNEIRKCQSLLLSGIASSSYRSSPPQTHSRQLIALESGGINNLPRIWFPLRSRMACFIHAIT